MTNLLRVTLALAALGVVTLAGGYLFDNHRCKQLDHERALANIPDTWVLDAGQCLDAARSLQMRHYARGVSGAGGAPALQPASDGR